MLRPAVFLDRDGTLNVEKQYLYRIKDWEWIEGAVDAIKLINQMGYLAIVVTNQAGVARGYYAESDIVALHQHIDVTLAKQGAKIDAYYYCPHHAEYGDVRNCGCRKPKPGMLLAAQKDFDIDLSTSFLIGDKAIDTIAAQNANVCPILVRTGYGTTEQYLINSSVIVEKDVFSAVKSVINQNTNYKNWVENAV